jgi:hypothetical protein
MANGMERKNININYNIRYNIRLCPHAIERNITRLIGRPYIEETVKTGELVIGKAKFPKVCLRRYFGKENITCFVIIQVHLTYCEVITAWKRKGN